MLYSIVWKYSNEFAVAVLFSKRYVNIPDMLKISLMGGTL